MFIKKLCPLTCLVLLTASHALAGPYSPAANQPGSSAVANSSQLIVEWASGFEDLVRGPMDISDPGGGLATFGDGGEALGFADGNPTHVVSLGDGGRITLTFAHPITNGAGFDFAVFENGFADAFLELAFVEVSSNGADFVRFPAVSLTSTAAQIGSFSPLDATNLDNLAGKYRGGFGVPFDLCRSRGYCRRSMSTTSTFCAWSTSSAQATHSGASSILSTTWSTIRSRPTLPRAGLISTAWRSSTACQSRAVSLC